ncbi:transcription factor far1-related partial [Lichtheimia corymbifera JMRC:FSU:9682]|uniref:Transcription factor far1-related partial n=1 Tax=Lichtheimia corymbifera JMRC:FSU:9682 TaxID=1263082 RepID=A0A068SGX2_9FUNG|nr:transcription factor far1-related partial [Lichtheimia corymbifera JMRC:FSU:9682]
MTEETSNALTRADISCNPEAKTIDISDLDKMVYVTILQKAVIDHVFSSKSEAQETIKAAYAEEYGVPLTVSNSNNRCVVLICKHGGTYRPHRKVTGEQQSAKGDQNGSGNDTSVTKSMKRQCPFKIYISTARDEESKWTIKPNNCVWYHSHPLSADPSIYHELRRPTGPQQIMISNLLEIKSRPAQIVDFIKKTDRTAMIKAKDVSNFTAKYFSTSSVDGELQEVVSELDSLGFTVRYELQQPDNALLKSIFVTHPKCIEQAVAFPDVVILDATYKTNVRKMPLVNIVGVSNLASEYKKSSLRTFSIAGDGTPGPSLFVSDDDPSLKIALEKHAPGIPHLLCAWHIEKNFMAKLGKMFVVDSKEYNEYLKAVKAMIWAKDEEGFDGGVKSYKEVIKGTKKEAELQLYAESLGSYRQKWGGPWAEQYAHFGSRTTQRVEGAHWQLKRILNTPGKLLQLFRSYHMYLKTMDFKATNKHEVERLTQYIIKDGDNGEGPINLVIKHLHGRISQFAICIIMTEMFAAYDPEEECDYIDDCKCEARVNFLLPCRHTLRKISINISNLVIKQKL